MNYTRPQLPTEHPLVISLGRNIGLLRRVLDFQPMRDLHGLCVARVTRERFLDHHGNPVELLEAKRVRVGKSWHVPRGAYLQLLGDACRQELARMEALRAELLKSA